MSKQLFKGWKGLVKLSGNTIGYCNNVSVRVSNNYDRYYELGSRLYAHLEAGNVEVDGTVGEFWVDKILAEYSAQTGAPPTGYRLELYPHTTTTSGSPYAWVDDVHFNDASLTMTPDDMPSIDHDFIAKAVYHYGSGLVI